MSTSASQAELFVPIAKNVRETRSVWLTCVASVAIHLVLLATLGLLRFAQKIDISMSISSIKDEEVDAIEPEFDTAMPEQMGSIGNDAEVYTFSDAHQAATIVPADPQLVIEKSLESTLEIAIPTFSELPQPSKSDVLASVATTGTTEHASGVEGAIDRLAWEIANSLREKKTLVVWLFDDSPSLNVRRGKIAERVENVYNQLNQLNVGDDKALTSAVAVFDAECSIVTNKPVDDAAELVKTVHNIQSKSSGDENTFAAVLKVARHFLPYRTEQHRDVMIIIVTDEEGSDPDNLDQAITYCKRYGMRCYCVGDSAPFGRKNIEAPFQLEDGERVIGVMQKGPESKFMEVLRLGYWGTNGQDLDEMPSGFGPYGLTRLCTETNGLYFITEEGRGQHRFDAALMRNYTPDYRPIPVLERDIQSNKAKLALFESCQWVEREAQSRKVLNIYMPRLEFRAESDTVLRRELTEAQKPIADLDASLDLLLGRLEQGEKDRLKIKEARWRASYDLAIGRTLALRTRAFGYNSMLAEMKVNPKTFETPGNNKWRLIPAKEITARIEIKKMANKASEYLNRVISEHPGTPWSLMAERENNVPMGWEWKESHYNPDPVMASGNQKAGPKFIDTDNSKQKPKPKKTNDPEPQRRDI